jgi:hypothetical protein
MVAKPTSQEKLSIEEVDLPQAKIDQIMYCHGFASHFDPSKDKVRMLSQLAPVIGVTVDYTRHPMEVFEVFSQPLAQARQTLIVGTSMGGFYAAWLGSVLDLPFIAINPAIAPSTSLRKHIGAGMTYFGSAFDLKAEIVDAYKDLPFRTSGQGQIVVDLGDEVIDSQATITAVSNRLPVITYPAGSHQFDHMREITAYLRKNFFIRK